MTEYACQYVVARFLKNPIRDEAKNIGIILQCSNRRYVGGMFEEELDRISMAQHNRTVISQYADWASGLSSMTAGGDSLFTDRELDPKFLFGISASSAGNIQFTEPRGCVTANPEETLEELYAMLVTPDEVNDGTAVRASEKSRTFPREFYSYLKTFDPISSANVKPNVRIDIGSKKLSFDYGYKKPGNRGTVLYETVDFSKGTFSNRINQASPTIVKYGIVRDQLPLDRYTRFAVVKPLGNGRTGTDNQELEILKQSAHAVFSFYDATQMANLIALLGQDFNSDQM